MGECMKTAWGVAGWLLLIMAPRAKSQHIEYCDSGEKNDYFNQLDYPIHVDLPLYEMTNVVSEERRLTDNYNAVNSGRSRPRIAYRLDFIAQEPIKRKPFAEDLYATIDRMASFDPKNAKSYGLLRPTPACHCNMHLMTPPPPLPFYRYAYKKNPSCEHHRHRHYKRIARDQSAANSLNAFGLVLQNSSRRKRDVYANGILRRSKTKQKVKRHPVRFVKLYRKKLPQRHRQPLKRLANSMREQVKRFQQKPNRGDRFKRPKLVKRDIKAEYELLERGKEQMDLTLPEIIQFMPETLQPDFRRGQCNIGCTAIRKSSLQDSTEASQSDAVEENDSNKRNIEDEKMYTNNADKAQLYFYLIPPPQNAIHRDSMVAYTDTYQRNDGIQKSADMPQLPADPFRTLSFDDENVYSPQQRPQRHIGNNQAAAPFFFVDGQWRATNNPLQHHEHELSIMNPHTGMLQASSADMAAPQYLGDLHSPEMLQQPGSAQPTSISREVLDKIVADIVSRHPDFVEAASHRGGALVDPELIQIADTKDLIHKLIAGRLRLWFGY